MLRATASKPTDNLARFAAAAAVAALLVLPGPAAAFPGTNGRIFFETQRPNHRLPEIYAMRRAGGPPTRVSPHNQAAGSPAVSPDGSRVAYHSGGGLWVMNANGSGPRRLTRGPRDHTPAWFPDGTRLAFTCDSSICTINADGSARAKIVADGDSPAISPDGTRLAFRRFTDFAPHFPDAWSSIYVMRLDRRGDTRNVTPEERPTECREGLPAWGHVESSHAPAWSPDGRRIAFAGSHNCDAPAGHQDDIWVMNADGSAKTNLTDGDGSDSAPAFSPDGSEIVFERDTSWSSHPPPTDLIALDLGSKAQHNLTRTPNTPDRSPDWQAVPACTRTGTSGDDILTGTAGRDVVCGLGGRDMLNGAGGDDIVRGGPSNDRLVGGEGRDVLDGGSGADEGSYSGNRPVIASLLTGFATGLGADALVSLEGLRGSTGGDRLTGSQRADLLIGGLGPDAIYGLSGRDGLNSRDRINRNDRVSGGPDRDVCVTDRVERAKAGCP